MRIFCASSGCVQDDIFFMCLVRDNGNRFVNGLAWMELFCSSITGNDSSTDIKSIKAIVEVYKIPRTKPLLRPTPPPYRCNIFPGVLFREGLTYASVGVYLGVVPFILTCLWKQKKKQKLELRVLYWVNVWSKFTINGLIRVELKF